ncbi:uncharacterized protein LOC126355893 isoform X3 [Schistocerca gregaria]|uniref:uncharacterized protein LOC126355893 isoform X3 n=1 Tax=Schistocerca gregaria TaxID=7010 RepID=UPI00211E098F|nr:uncharacterized protein LOC126355893 isoform X3 [Schistocerca gregaria]
MTVSAMLLRPDETYEQAARQLLWVLSRYDEFLERHRIRPDFFCRHREKQALQRCLGAAIAQPRQHRQRPRGHSATDHSGEMALP